MASGQGTQTDVSKSVTSQERIERISTELNRLNPESLDRVERFIRFEKNEPSTMSSSQR